MNEPKYIVSTKYLPQGPGKEDIKILMRDPRFNISPFTKDEFIQMYREYTGCGEKWAEGDFRKYSRKNSRSRWIIPA